MQAQGVLCGDCLFMRYGENVTEALANPEWTCPMCRDICNCSWHRTRKGWCPTGTLYRRAIADGRDDSICKGFSLTPAQRLEKSGRSSKGRFFTNDKLDSLLIAGCTAGYLSVAHYLVMQNLAKPDAATAPKTTPKASAKPAASPETAGSPAGLPKRLHMFKNMFKLQHSWLLT